MFLRLMTPFCFLFRFFFFFSHSLYFIVSSRRAAGKYITMCLNVNAWDAMGTWGFLHWLNFHFYKQNDSCATYFYYIDLKAFPTKNIIIKKSFRSVSRFSSKVLSSVQFYSPWNRTRWCVLRHFDTTETEGTWSWRGAKSRMKKISRISSWWMSSMEFPFQWLMISAERRRLNSI